MLDSECGLDPVALILTYGSLGNVAQRIDTHQTVLQRVGQTDIPIQNGELFDLAPLLVNTPKTALLAFLLLTLSLLSVWGWAQYCIFRGREPSFFFFVADSNKPLAVATAVALFLFFKNLKIGYSRVINTIAASAFGVLLIHANSDAMRQWLWKDTLNNVGHFEQGICLYVVTGVTAIYIACTLIDFLRIHLFEKPVFKVIDSFLNSRKDKK